MAKPILIIEDDPDIAYILRYSLEKEKFETRGAFDGKEGLLASLDQNNPPALILLDLLLPSMNGIEICRRLRREPATANIPIVMVTAKSSASDYACAFAAGANEYITKPFSIRKIIDCVVALLSNNGIGNARSQL